MWALLKHYRLIKLVGEQDQEDEKRDNEKAVTQSWIRRRSSLVGVHVRHPQQDAREDDGVEDAHQGDAEDDPEGDEGDLPGPGDDAVELEGEKDELEDVDGAEQLEFKGTIVAHGPDTDGDGDHADEDQRDKDEDPHVPVDATTGPGVKIVSAEELEHEEEEVDGEADEHGLVLDVLLRVQPGLRPPPPDVRADGCSSNCDAFPDPERDEDRPPWPVDHLGSVIYLVATSAGRRCQSIVISTTRCTIL